MGMMGGPWLLDCCVRFLVRGLSVLAGVAARPVLGIQRREILALAVTSGRLADSARHRGGGGADLALGRIQDSQRTHVHNVFAGA
jgi:hypothetical protein